MYPYASYNDCCIVHSTSTLTLAPCPYGGCHRHQFTVLPHITLLKTENNIGAPLAPPKKHKHPHITQCRLQYYVQPPLPPPPPQHKLQCMHSVYAPLLLEKDHHHRHHTVQATILQPTTTTTTTTISTTTVQITMHAFSICATDLGKKTDHQCKLLWASSSTSTLQTTACAKEYMRTVVEDKDHQRKLQRVKNYTTTIGVHNAASTCNLHKGMPLNF